MISGVIVFRHTETANGRDYTKANPSGHWGGASEFFGLDGRSIVFMNGAPRHNTKPSPHPRGEETPGSKPTLLLYLSSVHSVALSLTTQSHTIDVSFVNRIARP